jgi:peptide/nickel transport system permease protein
MSRFVVRRIVVAIPTALLVVIAAFMILHLTPGDPVLLITGEGADPQTVEIVRHQLGLDRSLPEQLIIYGERLAHLDLGTSLRSSLPVRDAIAARLPNTLLLASTALVIAIVLGVPLGLFTALRYGSAWDVAGLGLATLLVSTPTFWLGILLIDLFAVGLGWLPAAGIGGPLNLVLPTLALLAGPLALVTRIVRAEALEVLGEDYVRTARAKGLTDGNVVLWHVVRNALLPVVTVIGLQFGHAFDGAVVAEAVFAWPGMGQLLVGAISQRDYPIVQGCLLVIGVGFVFTNLLIDLTYAYIDPRIRFG